MRLGRLPRCCKPGPDVQWFWPFTALDIFVTDNPAKEFISAGGDFRDLGTPESGLPAAQVYAGLGLEAGAGGGEGWGRILRC